MKKKTPYEILGIDPSADDKAIRNAYLNLIKKHSPDSDPERFKEIAAAYDTISDEKKRLEYYLFDKDTSIDHPSEILGLESEKTEKRKPPDFNTLKEILRDV